MRTRRIALIGAGLALSTAGCADATQPPPRLSAALRSAPELVFMQTMVPQTITWENVSIDATGTGRVGFFFGETVGTVYRPFRLSGGGLRRLRALLGELATGPTGLAQRSALETNYLIRAGARSEQTTQTHVPTRMRPLVGFLLAIINRYAWTGPIHT